MGMLADGLQAWLGDALPAIATLVLCASVLLTLYVKAAKPSWSREGALNELFDVAPLWAVMRALGALFALMIVDYFLIDRGRFTHQNLIAQAGQLPIFHPVAFLCYAAGAALAYYWNWVAPLSFGASLPVFVVTGLLYYIATRWQRRTGGASA